MAAKDLLAWSRTHHFRPDCFGATDYLAAYVTVTLSMALFEEPETASPE
jgi:hypothetical protein